MRIIFICFVLLLVQCAWSADDDLVEDLKQLRLVADTAKIRGGSFGDVRSHAVLTLRLDSPLYPVSAWRLKSLTAARALDGQDLLALKENESSIEKLSNQNLDIKLVSPRSQKPVLETLQCDIELVFARSQYQLPITYSEKDDKDLYALPMSYSAALSYHFNPKNKYMFFRVKHDPELLLVGADKIGQEGKPVFSRNDRFDYPTFTLSKLEGKKKAQACLHWHGDLFRVTYSFQVDNLSLLDERKDRPYSYFSMPVVLGTNEKKLSRSVAKSAKRIKPQRIKLEPYFKSMEQRIEQIPLVDESEVFLAKWETPMQPNQVFDVFEDICFVVKSKAAPDPDKYYYSPVALHPLTRVNGEYIQSAMVDNVFKRSSGYWLDTGVSPEANWMNLGLGLFRILDRSIGKHEFAPVVFYLRNSEKRILRLPAITYEIVVKDESKAAYELLQKEGALDFFTQFDVARREGLYEKHIRYYDELKDILIEHPVPSMQKAFVRRFNHLYFSQIWVKDAHSSNRLDSPVPFNEDDVRSLLDIIVRIDHSLLLDRIQEMRDDIAKYNFPWKYGPYTATEYVDWLEKALQEAKDKMAKEVNVFGQKINK